MDHGDGFLRTLWQKKYYVRTTRKRENFTWDNYTFIGSLDKKTGCSNLLYYFEQIYLCYTKNLYFHVRQVQHQKETKLLSIIGKVLALHLIS